MHPKYAKFACNQIVKLAMVTDNAKFALNNISCKIAYANLDVLLFRESKDKDGMLSFKCVLIALHLAINVPIVRIAINVFLNFLFNRIYLLQSVHKIVIKDTPQLIKCAINNLLYKLGKLQVKYLT